MQHYEHLVGELALKCGVMQYMVLISQTPKHGQRTSEHDRKLTASLVLTTDQLHIVGTTVEGEEQESHQMYFEYQGKAKAPSCTNSFFKAALFKSDSEGNVYVSMHRHENLI